MTTPADINQIVKDLDAPPEPVIDPAVHDGDCTIYASLCNGEPWDGICTCGGGARRARRDGSDQYQHMLSPERFRAMHESEQCA